jgi:hypothetical protein
VTSRKERRTDDLRDRWRAELEEVLREVEGVDPSLIAYLVERYARDGRPPPKFDPRSPKLLLRRTRGFGAGFGGWGEEDREPTEKELADMERERERPPPPTG